MDLSLQMQQRQMLSQRMQQSVEILQMNTLALSEYIREMTEENPLLEWKEEMSEARGTIPGVIFTPKHEHGLKLLRGQRH